MKKLYFYISALLISLSVSYCSSSVAINDLFGIEMKEYEARFFNIVSYDESNGANYTMSKSMNPDLYAWANIGPKDVLIKIVNNTDREIPLNYIEDHFILNTKNGKVFELSKGQPEYYPNNSSIFSKSTKEFVLELPSNFAESINKRQLDTNPEDYTFRVGKAENTLRLVNEEIKYIVIKLGAKHTIVLKTLPNLNKPKMP